MSQHLDEYFLEPAHDGWNVFDQDGALLNWAPSRDEAERIVQDLLDIDSENAAERDAERHAHQPDAGEAQRTRREARGY